MFAVAIDGPAGAGKSSLAKAAAQELGFVYVDTGALYRTVALYLLERGEDPGDPQAAQAALPHIQVGLEHSPEGQKMYLCGREVTGLIRTPEVSMAASKVSAIPAVRAFLLELQRDLARKNNVLMDGRDIGTVVLPDAGVKIFLTAAPEARAMRRYKELVGKGIAADYDTVLREVKERDYNDSHREAAPLRQAEDAWLCDTTGMTLEQSIDAVVDYIKGRMQP